MNKRKRHTDRVARRKVAVPLTESTTEPTPPLPVAAPDTATPGNAPLPSANHDEEANLAHPADDGSLSTSQADAPLPMSHLANTLSLEQRVRRLEDALALLQEQRPAEQPAVAPPTAAVPNETPPTSTAILLDVGKRLLGAASPTAASAPLPIPSIAQPANRAGIMWLLWDTWAEARIIVRMFVDPRHHLSWSARLLPLILLAAILTSYYWVPGSSIPLLGSWINKAVDLLLAFLLFKWLGHEARRYRHTSPDLPTSLRL